MDNDSLVALQQARSRWWMEAGKVVLQAMLPILMASGFVAWFMPMLFSYALHEPFVPDILKDALQAPVHWRFAFALIGSVTIALPLLVRASIGPYPNRSRHALGLFAPRND